MIFNDHITVTGLEIETIVGVYPAERTTLQTISIDLKLYYPFGPSALEDDFQKAVDYDRLTEQLSEFVQKKQFELLETLSVTCCDYLLKGYPLSAVELTVHKPSALSRATCVSATFFKERSQNALTNSVAS